MDVNGRRVSSGVVGKKRNIEVTTALETIQMHWMGTVAYLAFGSIQMQLSMHQNPLERLKRKKSPNSFSVGTRTCQASKNMTLMRANMSAIRLTELILLYIPIGRAEWLPDASGNLRCCTNTLRQQSHARHRNGCEYSSNH